MLSYLKVHQNHTILFLIFSIFYYLLFKYLVIDYNLENNNLLHSDQFKYWKLSNFLIENKFIFDEKFGSLRVPLYPLFLSFIKLISDNIYFIIFIQSIIGILNIFILSKIYFLIQKKINIYLFVFSLVNINLLNSSTFILTEAIFLTFFLLYIYFFLKLIYARENKIKSDLIHILFCGLFLGLSTLTRPIAFYYSIIFVVIFLKEISFLKKISYILLFIISFSVALAPWNLRNLHYFDSYKLTTSVSDNLIGYYLPYIKSNEKKISLAQAKKEIYSKENMKIIDSKDKNIKINFFKNNIKDVKLTIFVETWIEGGLKLLLSPSVIETFYNLKVPKDSFSKIEEKYFLNKAKIYILDNSNKIFTIMVIISLLVGIFFKLVVSIFIFSNFKKYKKLNIIFLILLFTTLALVGPLGSARYRLILEPFLIIYLVLLLDNFKQIKFFTK